MAQGADITSAKSFIDAVKEVKIDLLEIKSDNIDAVQKTIPEKLVPAAGTFLIHQIIWKRDDMDNLYLRKRSCAHNNNFSPCKVCDLEVPIYNPTAITPAKKSTKKIRTHKKKIEKKPETATLTEKPKSKPKKNTKNSTVKKILNVSSHETKKSGKLFTENEWIAVNEEDTDWYVGKVKNIKEVGGKKLVTIESIMIRSSMKKSKHFQLEHNQNSEKQIFFDDIVCKISTPKELKKPKNFFSIKEFNNIEKLVKFRPDK